MYGTSNTTDRDDGLFYCMDPTLQMDKDNDNDSVILQQDKQGKNTFHRWEIIIMCITSDSEIFVCVSIYRLSAVVFGRLMNLAFVNESFFLAPIRVTSLTTAFYWMYFS
jgi:hypothetical protein